jgi:hypothetical protein
VVRLTASNAALPSSGRSPYLARPRRDGTTPDCLATDNDAAVSREEYLAYSGKDDCT